MLLVAACGGDDGGTGGTPDAPTADPDEGARSGTRLRLQWHDYGEIRTEAGLYDLQLSSACSPTLWTDGNTYCTPTAARVVYSDTLCTQPVGQAPHLQGCTVAAPSYFLANAVVGCALRAAHLYAAGTPIAAAPYYLPDSVTGECSGPFTSSTNFDYYTVGAEVSPTTLIPLTRAPAKPADTGRLQRRFLTSSDGAAAFTTPHDTTLDVACAPTLAVDATSTVCAPDASQATYFNDDKCTVGELVTRTQCTKPAFASQQASPECAVSATRYFRVGATVTDPTVYIPSTTCTSTDGPLDSLYYLLGEPVTAAPLTRSRDTVAGRKLQLIHLSDGATTVRDPLLFDAQHMLECEQDAQGDGTTRCLPRSVTIGAFFTDDTCSTPIQLAQFFIGPDTCAAPSVSPMVTRALPPTSATCGTTYEVYETGAQFTGALFTGSPAACVPVTATGVARYALGAQHALTEFPLGTLTRD